MLLPRLTCLPLAPTKSNQAGKIGRPIIVPQQRILPLYLAIGSFSTLILSSSYRWLV